eukprot:3788167-Ditylum_brightwellii.AAC.1
MGRSIVIGTGEGPSKYMYDGGNGGQVSIYGGAPQGPNWENDHGGNVRISGHYANKAKGDSLNLNSGFGQGLSSGSIIIATSDAGSCGTNGGIDFSTGISST